MLPALLWNSENCCERNYLCAYQTCEMEFNRKTEIPRIVDRGLHLRVAAEKGKVQEVKRLLAVGAPVTTDTNGLTALHKAAKWGHTNAVKLLLSCKRFNVNMQDKYGWTALHWAAWSGHISTIHALVAHSRCIVNAVDKSGSNALHCAALNGHAGVVRVLVPVKCDVSQQRKDGWTPLHLACWNGHQDVVHELIVSKCKINLRTSEGMGALHLAAAKGYGEILQELLDAGAAPDMQDKFGNTSLHEAAKWHHQNTVRLLMFSNCRINVRNSQGETPMDIARKEGYNDIIAQLSGLENCNLQESQCGCAELKKIILGDNEILKSNELKKLKWICEDGENIKNQLEAKIRRTSETRALQIQRSWQERLELARAEVLAHCESRIAEVEKQCRQKVALIERQCNERLQVARQVLTDVTSTGRVPSTPSISLYGRPFSSSCSITSPVLRAGSL